ncbi:DUF2505 domain-containing protein [Pseudactinotalea sp. Z1739]|uniref:DUF2505 domain-containing protein n=1 Tax=Pseudactinotalea sp. Z1739 TaxID=3413028 RepID=UPI003C7E3BCF
MRFEVTHDYPADPARVARMLGDEEYLRDSARASGSVSARHEVAHSEDGAFIVSATRRMPTDTIPHSMRSLVGSTIELKMVQAWGPADAEAGRTATVSMDITGAPARCTARTRLSGDAETTRVRYEGEVSAPIPLVGPAVEKAVVQAVQRVLEAEYKVGLERLGRS